MISQTAEYALRAIVFLADQKEPRTNSQISEAIQIPMGYLAKVMHSLSRAGLVKAQRGVNGGFTLPMAPEDLTVLRVINAINPIRRIHECPLGLHGKSLCPLHQSLDDAARAVEETFGDTSIADLLNVPRHKKPLCPMPQ